MYLRHLCSVPRLLLAGGALLLPAFGSAEQVAIEHKDVACFVAGQFPVLDACFNPGPGLARARVFFRPEGATTWYYVEAKTSAAPKLDAPNAACRKATLPKPRKQLLKKHVEYYVEATGRGMETSQTETFRPLVVASEGECKNKLVAPYLPTAAVQVFPALPAAFAAGGGLSTVAVAAVVTAGVAGTTGAVVAATNGNNPTPTVTQPSSPNTTAPPITVPPTTATTTLPPPAAFNPVFQVFRAGVLDPGSTIVGAEPLPLRFFMCDSSGPSKLKFSVSVNGIVATAGCDTSITFTSGGFTPSSVGSVTGSSNVHASGTLFNVVMLMQSDAPGNNPKSSRVLVVDVSTVTAPTTTTTSTSTSTTSTSTTSSTTTTTFGGCGTDFTGPTNTDLATPKNGDSFTGGPPSSLPPPPPPFAVNFTSFPTDPAGIGRVDYYALDLSGAPFLLGTGSISPDYLWTVTDFSNLGGCLSPGPVTVFAKAFDICGNATVSPTITIQLMNAGACSFSPPQVQPFSRPSNNKSDGGWVSQLDILEGRGQVVLNSSSVLFPGAGRVALAARPRSGENRVEATLVQAAGQPGLWRFELVADRVVAGSLRVIAGQVALVTGDVVAFKMKGQPGERVVFTFRSR